MRHWRDQDEEDRPTCQQNRYLSLVPIVADLSVFGAFCRTRICRDPVQCTYIAVFESDPVGYGVFCLSLIQRDLVYFAVLGSFRIRCILPYLDPTGSGVFCVFGSIVIQRFLPYSDPSGSSVFCRRILRDPVDFALLVSV